MEFTALCSPFWVFAACRSALDSFCWSDVPNPWRSESAGILWWLLRNSSKSWSALKCQRKHLCTKRIKTTGHELCRSHTMYAGVQVCWKATAHTKLNPPLGELLSFWSRNETSAYTNISPKQKNKVTSNSVVCQHSFSNFTSHSQALFVSCPLTNLL